MRGLLVQTTQEEPIIDESSQAVWTKMKKSGVLFVWHWDCCSNDLNIIVLP